MSWTSDAPGHRVPSAATRFRAAGNPGVPRRRPRTASVHRPVSLRQLLVGLVALPLSVLPFVAYANLTPEGRLVRDKALVAISPPTLPRLSAAERDAVRAHAPRYQGGVMVLAYHGIGSGSDAEGGFVVSPGRFGEHLATLREAGLRTVTAAQVARAFEDGRPLPANAVVLTFDDGRTDAMLFADPLLEQAGMAATMFVISGAASRPGVYYASWDDLEGYARSGRWDLQSHTEQSHHDQEAEGGGKLPALTSLAPGESVAAYRARIRRDLAAADASIASHTGRRPVAFAYPFGAYGADRTNHPALRQVLREEVAKRYTLAFHQDEQETIPLATAEQDRLGLRRLEVENWSGLDLLDRISGAARAGGPPPPEPAAPVTLEPALPLPGLPSPLGEVPGAFPRRPRPPVRPPTRVPMPLTGTPGVTPARPPAVGPSARPASAAPVPVPAPVNRSPGAITNTVVTPPTTDPPPPECTHTARGKGPKGCPPSKAGG